MNTQELYDENKLELAFELAVSQFVEYRESNEIVSFLFSLPSNTWFKMSLFSDKFIFLSDFIKNDKIVNELKISVCWMRHPEVNNPYYIILFLEEVMSYSRVAFYNTNQLASVVYENNTKS